MSHPEVELQPDDLEALQAETDDRGAPAARVEIVGIDGPVRTQDLPRKAASTRTVTVGLVPVQLLRADHRRAVARVMSIGQNVRLAFSQASAQEAQSMSLWPQNVAYNLTADTELWAVSASGTTQVSVSCEFWATGV